MDDVKLLPNEFLKMDQMLNIFQLNPELLKKLIKNCLLVYNDNVIFVKYIYTRSVPDIRLPAIFEKKSNFSDFFFKN